MPIILATQKAEIQRITVQSQSQKIVCEILSWKVLHKIGLVEMEFYVAMKKNEMLSFAGKWVELENIILS
jgi:hypothetical protein